jgi:DNA polymerase elongation subunit (family B)
MSISIKAVVPKQVQVKKLFDTNRADELHIFAISYYYCDEYLIEAKPSGYRGVSRTLFLKEFGANIRNPEWVMCQDEKQMFGLFEAELRRLDPDILVCHDSGKILDTLIQRMARVGDRQKPKLGRLVFNH